MRIQAWKIGSFLICILGISLFMHNLGQQKQPNQTVLNVWTRFKPTSADPMKYDLSVHHITMRSVLASLVSVYKNGEITPQMASSWTKSSDSKTWKVILNPNWTFDNGDRITPAIVVKNFKRVLILKNLENSKSGFLEFLQDAEKIKAFDQEIPGISAEKR